ncbi:MAG: serine/threonine protein kinase [Pirellulales bacterium]|nr:serine/threonine protein kinase [Pirellulales bacterium]
MAIAESSAAAVGAVASPVRGAGRIAAEGEPGASEAEAGTNPLPPAARRDEQGEGGAREVAGRLGAWQLVKLINESELARVYLARPAEAGESVAPDYVVKVLRNQWWRDSLAIEMQRRAAWVGRKVSHPHLLPVLSANVKQPPFYIVSPRLEGHSLAAILRRHRTIATPAALWIARQVAEGLDALHTVTRMVHADVKPANVVVGPDGHATLVDLGFVHTPAEARHWTARPVFGTLNYMAPETISSAIAADQRSDLYSLGVMLFEMLAGELPLASTDAQELIRLHREGKPQCLSELRPGTPAGVVSLVQRLLAKDPLRRPESAGEVADQLIRLEIECFAAGRQSA